MDNKLYDKHVLDQILIGAFASVYESRKSNSVGMIWSNTIIMAFITELAIKYMLQEEGKACEIPRGKNGHNLSFLYGLLDKATKNKVENEADRIYKNFFKYVSYQMEPQINTIMKKHDTLFNDIRYGIFDTNMNKSLTVTFNELSLAFVAITNNTDLDIHTSIQNKTFVCKSEHQPESVVHKIKKQVAGNPPPVCLSCYPLDL